LRNRGSNAEYLDDATENSGRCNLFGEAGVERKGLLSLLKGAAPSKPLDTI
jgi:hypothetical protein